MANVRYIPPDVMAAILRGDTKALEAMSAAGNRRKKQLRQAVMTAKARADAQRQAEEAQRAAEDAEHVAFCETLWRQQVYADAVKHDMGNLAGSKQD